MVPQPCNGMIQVVLDTVNSVQLRMKNKLPIISDEAREKQLPERRPEPEVEPPSHPTLLIDPFTNEVILTKRDMKTKPLSLSHLASFFIKLSLSIGEPVKLVSERWKKSASALAHQTTCCPSSSYAPRAPTPTVRPSSSSKSGPLPQGYPSSPS